MWMLIHGRLLYNIGTELIIIILTGLKKDSVVMSWLEIRENINII